MSRKDISKDGKPFVKGDPRCNRKGAPKKIPALEVIFAEVFGDNDKMKAIIEALEKKAKSGDNRAAELLMDRVYGKLSDKLIVDEKVSIDWHETKTYLKNDSDS